MVGLRLVYDVPFRMETDHLIAVTEGGCTTGVPPSHRLKGRQTRSLCRYYHRSILLTRMYR